MASCSTTTRHHYPHHDGPPNFNVDVSKIPNAVPKIEPISKYGNPSSYVVNGHRYYVLKTAAGYDETGIASWYGTMFYHKKTSSGEPYNMLAMTAANKVLPLPTYVQVTNLKTGTKIIVKVNDRGPFRDNRIIDLSYVAAKKMGMLATGTALVEVKVINPACPPATTEFEHKVIGHAQIYLQIGAFGIEDNAQRLQAQIKEHTQYPVIIKTMDKNGQTLYRVQIGPIPTVDSTDNLHNLLMAKGLGEPMTVIQ